MTFALGKKTGSISEAVFRLDSVPFKEKERKHNRVPLVGPQKFEVIIIIIIIIFYIWLYGGVNLNCAQQCLGYAVKEVNWFSINKCTQKNFIGVEGKSCFTSQSSHSNQQF